MRSGSPRCTVEERARAIVRRCHEAVRASRRGREAAALVVGTLSDSDVVRAAMSMATVDGAATLGLLCEPRVASALCCVDELRLSPDDVLTVLQQFVSCASARDASLDRVYAPRVEMLVSGLRDALSTTLHEPVPAERFALPAVQTALVLALHQVVGAEELIGGLLSTQLSRVERQHVDDMRADIEEVRTVDQLLVQAVIRNVVAAVSARW
jgi:hypothetical protein